jgi:hypothetical protein
MATVYCDRCEKVVRAGSGAKVKFNFTSPNRLNESGTFCTACAEALVRSAVTSRRIAKCEAWPEIFGVLKSPHIGTRNITRRDTPLPCNSVL